MGDNTEPALGGLKSVRVEELGVTIYRRTLAEARAEAKRVLKLARQRGTHDTPSNAAIANKKRAEERIRRKAATEAPATDG